MSVLDQLRALEQHVQQRLRELGPLVAEYRDLEKVAERLGLKRDGSDSAEVPAAKPAPGAAGKTAPARKRAAKAAARKPRPATRAAKTPAAKRTAKVKPPAAAGAGTDTAAGEPRARRRAAAAPGQRQQDVLRLVRERPGITVAELAVELGVDATGLYAVVRRLQSKDEIRKDGSQLQPVLETAPTTDAAATPAVSDAATASDEPPAESAETPASES